MSDITRFHWNKKGMILDEHGYYVPYSEYGRLTAELEREREISAKYFEARQLELVARAEKAEQELEQCKAEMNKVAYCISGGHLAKGESLMDVAEEAMKKVSQIHEQLDAFMSACESDNCKQIRGLKEQLFISKSYCKQLENGDAYRKLEQELEGTKQYCRDMDKINSQLVRKIDVLEQELAEVREEAKNHLEFAIELREDREKGEKFWGEENRKLREQLSTLKQGVEVEGEVLEMRGKYFIMLPNEEIIEDAYCKSLNVIATVRLKE